MTQNPHSPSPSIEQTIALLKRWAELEPRRCQRIQHQECWYQVFLKGIPFDVLCHVEGDPPWEKNYALITRAVLEAIAAAELKLRQENVSSVWSAMLLEPDLQTIFSELNGEVAIALLKPYLDWLELHHDDPAVLKDAAAEAISETAGAMNANAQAHATEGDAA